VANGLENVVKENRMRFSGIAAPEDDDVRLLDFTVGTRPAASSENRRQTGDAWGVSSSVTAVDVVAAHRGAHEFLRSEVHLVRGFRAAEHPEGCRAVPIDHPANSCRRPLEGFIPGRGA